MDNLYQELLDGPSTSNGLFSSDNTSFMPSHQNSKIKGYMKNTTLQVESSEEEYDEEEEEEESSEDDNKETDVENEILEIEDDNEDDPLEDILKFKFNNLKRKTEPHFDLLTSKPKKAKSQTTPKDKKSYNTGNMHSMNIFRKISSNSTIPDYMKTENNKNILLCQFSNYVLRVPLLNVNFNYNDLQEAVIPLDSKPTKCNHIFECQNIQIACGDEAFTNIKICKLCNLTKTK